MKSSISSSVIYSLSLAALILQVPLMGGCKKSSDNSSGGTSSESSTETTATSETATTSTVQLDWRDYIASNPPVTPSNFYFPPPVLSTTSTALPATPRFTYPRSSYMLYVGVPALIDPSYYYTSGAHTFSLGSTLPSGLSLNISGRISGTPTVAKPRQNYTVYLSDSTGLAYEYVKITVWETIFEDFFSSGLAGWTSNVGAATGAAPDGTASTLVLDSDGDTVTQTLTSRKFGHVMFKVFKGTGTPTFSIGDSTNEEYILARAGTPYFEYFNGTSWLPTYISATANTWHTVDIHDFANTGALIYVNGTSASVLYKNQPKPASVRQIRFSTTGGTSYFDDVVLYDDGSP